jgi:seryl-tRNA synthetase
MLNSPLDLTGAGQARIEASLIGRAVAEPKSPVDYEGISSQDVDTLPMATDSPGIYLFPEGFERIIAALRSGIDLLGSGQDYRRLAIPPVISRRMIERAGYVNAFPQLLGTVHSYAGDGRGWSRLAPLVADGGDWHAEQEISDLVLLPAACYPVYASITGAELSAPIRFMVTGNCFRQEATSEIGRLRSFRMTEYVTAGTEQHCVQWRADWLERVAGWLADLDLAVSIEVADDPFFGPGRKLYQAAQRAQELKLELKVPLDADRVQAVASANYHKDHFGEGFGFSCGGEVGHTACMAFGLERIALALVHRHGERLADWPADVRALLGR